MRDQRITRLAEILVDYSTRVQPGETVLIRSTDAARPLVEEVYRLVTRRGAYPITDLSFGSLAAIWLQEAGEHQLDYLHPLREATVRQSQVLINIYAPENTKALTNVDAKRSQRWARTNEPVKSYVSAGNVRWVLCNFPTQALAQDAGMTLDEYADFVFAACNVDWDEMRRQMTKMKDLFDSGDEVRITGPGTDLRFRLGGRPGIVSAGERNMPSGEVFYAPIEDSAEGTITYEYPAIYGGREVDGVRLRFEQGRVVHAEASRGNEYLQEVLNTDEGAQVIGEFGIGLNYGIQDFTRDILFDEKIGGTIHLALGSAYPACGGHNRSAVHWDMIKDLRRGGELYLDGRLVERDGRWLAIDDEALRRAACERTDR